MSGSIQAIPLANLVFVFIPPGLVLFIFYKFGLGHRELTYALGRMLLQLLLIGYFLVFIFNTEHWGAVAAVLGVMVIASSWISLRVVKEGRTRLFPLALASVATGGGSTLLLIIFAVLRLDPWYLPRYVIPLAGMIFAASMNTISLAAERFRAERSQGATGQEARKAALKAALIPRINSLFAVGLVSLPGMMTGQILSGISPLIAARYQIMVMCMIFGASGLSAASFLLLAGRHLTELAKAQKQRGSDPVQL